MAKDKDVLVAPVASDLYQQTQSKSKRGKRGQPDGAAGRPRHPPKTGLPAWYGPGGPAPSTLCKNHTPGKARVSVCAKCACVCSVPLCACFL